MNHTTIGWVRNPDNKTLGFTSNPISGCLTGCDYCYARKLANTRLKHVYLTSNAFLAPALVGTDPLYPADPFWPRFWPAEVEKLKYRAWKKPRGIFVGSMSDLFGPWVPVSWQGQIIGAMRDEYGERQDRFYVLTKHPDQMLNWEHLGSNVWAGASTPNADLFQEAVLYLSLVESRVRFISVEPFLEPFKVYPGDLLNFQWVIIGAMTCGSSWTDAVRLKYPLLHLVKWQNQWTLQPEPAWVQHLAQQAHAAGAKVFYKENLQPIAGQLGEWFEEMPE